MGMRALRLLVVLVGLSVSTNIGWTCCLAFADGTPMTLVGERAIIVWDAARQREHFVREASFDGEAKDFGFIVPAPTKPEVAEADEEAFQVLERLVPTMTSAGNDSVAASADAMDESVELIEQYMVGDFEVSVLKGTDGATINGWLKTNGYTSRPAMEAWLDHYAKMDWFFAALKFVRGEGQESPETTAVRVSFDTDVPFYPYKMPSDTWPEGHYRPISLFFVSNGVARGKFRGGDGEWEAKVRWSGELPRETARDLASLVSLDVMDIPEGATVTVFQNTENAEGYDHDVYFLTYTSVLPTWLIVVIAVAVIGGFTFALIKSRRSAPG